MNPLNNVSTVQQAEETEQHLIEAAKTALAKIDDCKWEIGRLAHEWTKRYANGRTDEAFGKSIGLSHEQVFQRRRVFEVFDGRRNEYVFISWSHFYATLTWDDAEKWLKKANRDRLSVARMREERGEAKQNKTAAKPVRQAAGPTSSETEQSCGELVSSTRNAAKHAQTKSHSRGRAESRETAQPTVADLDEMSVGDLKAKAEKLRKDTLPNVIKLAKAFNSALVDSPTDRIDIAELLRFQEHITDIFLDAVATLEKEVAVCRG